jgi:signal transduction histidine kinase/CheY-like chemotaxis protein/predicted hydrocarbon binding protein/HPt (histidine-containing phosphotransfer) domain-containing protein
MGVLHKNPSTLNLQKRIAELEKENAMLRRDFSSLPKGASVIVPDSMKPFFDSAEQTVNEYFRHLSMDPSKGTIEINDQRYLLVRASALSKDFLDTIQHLYADRGKSEAFSIGKNFLFDIAHVIGMNDAKNFHAKMNLTDPIAKLSAGPIHFSYTGWAFVDILPESSPSPDENFYLIYNHPFSFEADSWLRSGEKSEAPACIMNAGYSSGWCEESFGIPLTAVEVSCAAKGDESCTFIMSPPHKIQEHLEKFHKLSKKEYTKMERYDIPTFFDRKRVEEEMQKSRILAEESAKSKTDFVANMSHELRTPLGAILGFTDLLKKTELSPAQKTYLSAINTSGNSLLSIINDILDLSKLDAGKFIIENVSFSIPELIHSVKIMFEGKAKEKKLNFTLSTDPSIDYLVLGDPTRLTQILINLIGNAIKFTEAGSVAVKCVAEKHDGDNVNIFFSVKDTGIGIPDEKMENIFERFMQGDTNITRKYGGTGLGLAITKQLIELLGGAINLRKNDESGVEFYFTLPYQKIFQEKITPKSKELLQPFKFDAQKKVLIVEDNLMNQKLATIILQNNGFENIDIAENGVKAIDILKEKEFDLILMDIQMPIMDGYRATSFIRDELHISTPIIAMTAHALAGEKEKCIQIGMNDYLSKPFKENDLLEKISRWLTNVNSSALINFGTEKIIDLSFLMEQTKNNSTFILEMINIYKQQNPKDISTLEKSINELDFSTMYKTAHTLRNTIGFFGLTTLIGNELLLIEKLAKSSEGIDKIKECFNKIKLVCQQALSELETLDISTLLQK